jgi:hypothetical protein
LETNTNQEILTEQNAGRLVDENTNLVEVNPVVDTVPAPVKRLTPTAEVTPAPPKQSNITISKDTKDSKTIIISHKKLEKARIRCSAEPHNFVNELNSMLNEIGEEKFLRKIKILADAKNAMYDTTKTT